MWRSPFVTMVTTRTWLCHVFNKSQLSACGVSCGRQVVRFFYSAWELLFVVHWMLVYRAVFESESAPGCILVLLLVTLCVVCSRAVLCAGCRLAGCIVRGLRELSRQNIARWWIYTSLCLIMFVRPCCIRTVTLSVRQYSAPSRCRLVEGRLFGDWPAAVSRKTPHVAT